MNHSLPISHISHYRKRTEITHIFTYFYHTWYADLVILGLLVLFRISSLHYNRRLCVRQCALWFMRKTRTLSVRFRPFRKS